MKETKIIVAGKPIDDDTRCVHYHTNVDIIAIKFKCCNTYFPCFACHAETADHEAIQWPQNDWNTKAILCGKCKSELSVHEYLQCNNECPFCKAAFNPDCRLHHHLYFLK